MCKLTSRSHPHHHHHHHHTTLSAILSHRNHADKATHTCCCRFDCPKTPSRLKQLRENELITLGKKKKGFYLFYTVSDRTVLRGSSNTQRSRRACVCQYPALPDYLQMGSGGLTECGGSPWHAAHMIKSVIALQFTTRPPHLALSLSLSLSLSPLTWCDSFFSADCVMLPKKCAAVPRAPLSSRGHSEGSW